MARAKKVEKQRYVGLDLGKRTHQDAFVEENGKTVFSNGVNTADGRQALYKKLKRNDTVAIEAGNMAFIMAKEIAKTVGCKVLILNPGNLAVIYRSMKKTDKEDSLKLAHLVMYMPEDKLPVVAIPSDKEMEMREMACERREAVKERTKYINELHSLFLKAGITTIVKKNLATEGKRAEAAKLLKDRLLARAKALLEMISLQEDELFRIECLMETDSKGNEDIERLETIPGVGLLTAYVFLAYVKAERFSNASQVANYLGLVPKVDISCTIVKYGNITKRGNGYVRTLLNQAAWALVRSKTGGALKEWFLYATSSQGKGKKKSIVAVSRKLAALMFTLLRDKNKFEARKFVLPKQNQQGVSHLAEIALDAASGGEQKAA
jgi:transposase